MSHKTEWCVIVSRLMRVDDWTRSPIVQMTKESFFRIWRKNVMFERTPEPTVIALSAMNLWNQTLSLTRSIGTQPSTYQLGFSRIRVWISSWFRTTMWLQPVVSEQTLKPVANGPSVPIRSGHTSEANHHRLTVGSCKEVEFLDYANTYLKRTVCSSSPVANCVGIVVLWQGRLSRTCIEKRDACSLML